MIQDREKISVVWFKRDLRLEDNEAVVNALATGRKVLFVYIFEPSLLQDPHYSERHWNFIKQSIADMNESLEKLGTHVFVVEAEVMQFFKYLLSRFDVSEVFSHIETGLLKTFKRDKNFKRFCRNNSISWEENINNGVFRGRTDREHWKEDWEGYMKSELLPFEPYGPQQFISSDELRELEKDIKTTAVNTLAASANFQRGGRATAKRYLQSFFKERYVNYAKFISKPMQARESCSRLSPYLAWGNLSVREVYQEAKSIRRTAMNKRAIDAFTSRLRWQAHFIQKFEMECIMEKASINKGYHKLKKDISLQYQEAWKQGQTGIPIIDACMRCLQSTGYLNFRMRAMVVSFFTHNLWQPWQEASRYLSQVFLDFEPGIHFPQLQMQAGETGINTLRIYNPIKNGLEHDPNAVFIGQWVPELQKLPIAFRHEPYKLTMLEQKLYHFTLGKDYPAPIVDIAKTRKRASDEIWKLRKDEEVIRESLRIVNKHVTR
jgi:deoxyribodipyrimidine photo-lyase